MCAVALIASALIDAHLHVQGMLSEIMVFRETLRAFMTNVYGRRGGGRGRECRTGGSSWKFKSPLIR